MKIAPRLLAYLDMVPCPDEGIDRDAAQAELRALLAVARAAKRVFVPVPDGKMLGDATDSLARALTRLERVSRKP